MIKGKIPKNKRKIIIIAILVIISLVALFVRYEKKKNQKHIKVSGNIEATETNLSFRVEGKIVEMLADEGYSLKKDQLVSRIDTDELSKERDNYAAQYKLAAFSYKQKYDDYVRAENLYVSGAISEQKRDQYKTDAETTRSNMEAYKASLALAETRLGFANLTAPIDCFVLVKSAEVGEVVHVADTVFTVVDLSDIWLTAYIKETDLAKVKLNQRAYITTDSYKRKRYKGRISFISEKEEFTPKYIQTTEERVKLVYRIKIKLDNPDQDLKPGMPADGFIILD